MVDYSKYLSTISGNYPSNAGSTTVVDTTTKKEKKIADIISSFQNVPPEVSKTTPPAKNLYLDQFPNDKTVIKAPEKQTFWSGVKNFIGNIITPTDVVKDQVNYNLQKIVAEKQGVKQSEIPMEYIQRNRDAITKELGVRNAPTNGEIVGAVFDLALISGLVTNPVTTAIGIAGFQATSELISAGVSKIQGEKYKPLSGKGLSDLLPADINPTIKTGVDILQFALQAKAYHTLSTKAPKIAESLTKDITTKYNLPEKVSVDSATVRQFFVDDSKLDSKVRQSLVDVGLSKTEARNAVTNGINIELPWQKVVTITDKPYWEKVKNIFNVSKTEISTTTNIEKPMVGAAGALPEGKITPTAPIVLPKETINKIQGESSIFDLNRKLNERNTKNIVSETLAGNRESDRLNTPQNIEIAKVYNRDVIPENPTAETMIIVSRAGEGEIKPGDHVVFGEKGAERYLTQREGSKLSTKEVPLKDLVRSNGVGSEAIYAPSISLSENKGINKYKEYIVFDANNIKINQPKETSKISLVTKESIDNVKTIKDVKTSLKNIKDEYDNLTTEAEGIAVVAQEKRTGLNTVNIAKLKRIYNRSEKFQSGDIETIRSSNSGKLLDDVLEDIQIKYPEMSEQEAFDFAINLPNKSLESVKRSPEMRKLVEKEKTLKKYLESLTEKQKTLKLNEENEAYQEWQDVLASQEKLEKIVEVAPSQLPVGEGKEKVSRLEARVKDVLKNTNQETIDKLGLSTFNELSKKENIAAAAKYAIENPDDAIKVLTGEIEPPKGILRNAIYVAMQNQSIGDVNLAIKLASITSTRLGQEIGILTEIDPNSPVKAMSDIIKIREETFKKRYPGQSVKQVKDKIVKEIKNEVKKIDKNDWNDFINSIKC